MAKYKLSDIFPGNYPISQYFGANPNYYKKFGLAGHEGVDWALPTGTKLLAPFDNNIVIRTGWDASYGYYVVVWDNVQRCASWFCHLSRIYVTPGQRIKKGTVIGLSGNSGNTTGPHLHKGFVETDSYGNRLDRNNGYQGYKNVLSASLVYWVIYQLKQLAFALPKGKKPAQTPTEGKLTAEEVIAKDLAYQKTVFKA